MTLTKQEIEQRWGHLWELMELIEPMEEPIDLLDVAFKWTRIAVADARTLTPEEQAFYEWHLKNKEDWQFHYLALLQSQDRTTTLINPI